MYILFLATVNGLTYPGPYSPPKAYLKPDGSDGSMDPTYCLVQSAL